MERRDRVSIVDKHMPMHSHKLIGKDLSSSKRQLWASEDGKKGRDVALCRKENRRKYMNDV